MDANGIRSTAILFEIYINIISRLITTVFIEKVGVKLNTLKRLLRRIEQETIQDSQINYLEDLYRLEGKKRSDIPHQQ